MNLPKINTRATNVELTEERKNLIIQKLAPLSRYLRGEEDIDIDIVMRRVRVDFGGDMYCISVKVTTPSDIYMGVATEHHLEKALTRVRETLRRAISKGASVVEYQQRKTHREYVREYSFAT